MNVSFALGVGVAAALATGFATGEGWIVDWRGAEVQPDKANPTLSNQIIFFISFNLTIFKMRLHSAARSVPTMLLSRTFVGWTAGFTLEKE